ncbi:MAG TPA: ChaN family lipoprotein [Zeimonas sp.]
MQSTAHERRAQPRGADRSRTQPPGGVRVVVRLAGALLVATMLGACAMQDPAGTGVAAGSPAADALPLPAAARTADFVLFGELHDNVAQHRLRLRWLEELADVHPFALALEQFDADRQDSLDRARADDARAAHSASTADAASRARRIAEAAGFDFGGWDWDLYRPVIEFALRRGLPLVAANLSPADTARVTQQRAPAAPPPGGWDDDDSEAMRESIREGHCGLLSERAVEAMAAAQRTRDARIAQALLDAHARTGLPVVLLAGNGHLRRDIGVPRHLSALRPGARIASIALLERTPGSAQGGAQDGHRLEAGPSGSDRALFDLVVRTPAQSREDPCVKLRQRLRR